MWPRKRTHSWSGSFLEVHSVPLEPHGPRRGKGQSPKANLDAVSRNGRPREIMGEQVKKVFRYSWIEITIVWIERYLRRINV